MSAKLEITRDIIDSLYKPIGMFRTERRRRAQELAALLDKNCDANLPKIGETCAVAHGSMKSAALYYDRLWLPPLWSTSDIPNDVTFFCASKTEIWMLAARLVANTHIEGFPRLDIGYIIEHTQNSPLRKALASAIQSSVVDENARVRSLKETITIGNKIVSHMLHSQCGVVSSPVFSSSEMLQQEFAPGENQCIFAAISQLDIIDENQLDWQQVTEFRKDNVARNKLRRMRTWLDKEMVGKTIAQVSDAIATRLEDYEWSLRKHGIKTLTGTMTDLIDPRFIAAASPVVGGLWYAAGTGLAEIAAGGLAIGRIAVSLVEKLVDLSDRKRGQGSEVAFVHELKKLSK